MSGPSATGVAGLADWASNDTLVAPSHTRAIDEALPLDCGRSLAGHVLNYETYGTLAPDRDNVVLVCHSLTKYAHAAGRHEPGGPLGWWDAAIGPGKMLDTSRYFVICIDTLAAGGSTGPASTDPATGSPYALRFPVVTVRDMVAAHRQLLRHLGIERLRLAIGGCFGGEQVIEWAVNHPQTVDAAVVISATPATSAHTIAIFSVMRHLIRADPAWRRGDYYGQAVPTDGLNAAVAAAVPLWMSREAMAARFGRATSGGRDLAYTLDDEFAVEDFIAKLAANARHEVDPNSLMFLMRAVEYFDLERQYGSVPAAFDGVTASMLFVSYRNDWRYPPAQAERMHRAVTAAGGRSQHAVLDSRFGHGAFLFDTAALCAAVTALLATSLPS